MQLPEFQSQGTGPQGAEGIPPERIRQGLQQRDAELVNATLRPEDSAAAQQVLNQEVETLAAQLGVTPPQAPVQPDTPQTPAAQAPPPPSPPAPSPETPPQDDFLTKIRTVREKYKGDFEGLAKAYLHTDAARTRAQQERSEEISELRSLVEGMSAQLAAALTPKPDYPEYRETFTAPTAQQEPAAPATTTAEEFWANPEKRINDIFQQNLLKLKEAEQREARARRFEEKLERNAADLAKYRPLMAQIYQEDRELYENVPQDRALDALLKRAKERDQAIKAQQFYAEIAGFDGGAVPAGTPGGSPAPAFGALPSSGSSPRHANSAPTGNWSETQGMKRLWRTSDGSANEMGALTDVLKERGFGENI